VKGTLYRYVIDEIWPVFLAGLCVWIVAALATKMLPILDMILNRGVSGFHVLGLMLYMLPEVVLFVLPAASLMAVVVGFLRLSGDSEIVALSSSGISLYQLLPPVITLSTIGFFVALALTTIAVPWGNRSVADMAFRLAETTPDLGIKERVFCEPFDNLHFYVGGFSSKEKEMRDVFVVDRRDPAFVNTIVADRGAVVSHPKDRVIVVHFEEGAIFTVGRDLTVARTIEFKIYDLRIEMKDIFAGLSDRKKRPREMSISELVEQVRKSGKGDPKRNENLAELVEKVTLPFGVFLMGLTGVPLGAQIRLRGRAKGIAVSLIVFLFYYVFMGGMRNVCEAGGINPMVGLWLPNVFLLASCCYLMKRVASGEPLLWQSWSRGRQRVRRR
jgi:lipopolysaccharide export system permease protein